jgi:prepilin-type N-terminal cleavage/methylation domain-containing protein
MARSRLAGFTLIEMMTTIAILGITTAIAAPSYLAWADKQRLNAAQEQVMIVLRRTQNQAVRQKLTYQASFRETGKSVEWSIHPAHLPAQHWQSLPPQVQLDDETSLRKKKDGDNTNYVMQFNHYGEVNGQLGRVTLSSFDRADTKRCVMISTLLGAMRKGESHAKKRDNKFCY